MVSQERQHPALIWETAYDPFAPSGEVTGWWTLTDRKFGGPFGQEYARIDKIKDRQWMLTRWERPPLTRALRRVTTYHKTLKEAKALGLVEARFNIAQGLA